ncbi:MAG: exodeoxyribonuclease VII small subunit [Anaerofustis sp.]|jgi:exodeoxyribonuclease VII small subunit
MSKEISFEQNMNRLEEIVEDIQSNKITLNDSIRLFEEGMTLIGNLNEELNRAEEKVKVLLAKNGELKEADYNTGEVD